MKKLFRLVYSNKFFAISTLLIQLALILIFVFSVSMNTRYFLLASNLISTMLIIIEVNRHEESAFKITWIMLIAVIPTFGWFFYVYTHTGIISRSLKDSHATALKAVTRFRGDDSSVISRMENDGCSTSLVKFLSKTNSSRAYDGSAVKYYPLGDHMLDDIIAELECARRFIFIEFFIINRASHMWHEIERVLLKKAEQGVKIRIMYDGMGCMGIVPKDFDRFLEGHGIECCIFSPVQPLLSTYQNNRDHRKIIIVDGRVAFSGGVNIADEYINKISRFGHWKDTGIRIYGEGVSGYIQMFLTMWYTVSDADEDSDMDRYINSSKQFSVPGAKGYIAPFGDSPLDNIAVGRTAYVDILNNAQKYVHIMTPYFVIDDMIYEAMRYAVTRGVDVKIIMPGIPDKKMPYCLARSYYRDLFDIGVEVYEYIPGFVHAKTTVSDDRRAIVGTVNYDYRSLYLHYECASYLENVPEIADMEDDMIQTLSQCRQITITEYNNYPWYYRFTGRVLRFIATMI
ncbi:MAG: cardiolipin synthase [Clostridia bacterium]|nr:cardiolipin synthase [Clostridia bacterium]